MGRIHKIIGICIITTIISLSAIVIANGSVSQYDLNDDEHINILDLVSLTRHWDETGTPGWYEGDFNNDGVINILDCIMMGNHWTG